MRHVMGLLISGYSWNNVTLSDFSLYAIVYSIIFSSSVAFHGLVSPYFTDPKTESAQVWVIYHGSNSRSVFYCKIGDRVELDWCNSIGKLFILVLLVVLSPYFHFFLARRFYFWRILQPFWWNQNWCKNIYLRNSASLNWSKNGQLWRLLFLDYFIWWG